MKLNTLKQALEQLLATDLNEQDRQNVFEALQEIHETAERATDPDIYNDEVYLISANSMSCILNSCLYDTYGKRRKSYGKDFPASHFMYDARKVFGFEDFTNKQLQIGYDIISDLWRDNEAEGNHDENGYFVGDKPAVKLTLSSAECNCLIEAIQAANEQVCAGKIIYCKDGYMPEEEQSNYACITQDIANTIADMIEAEEAATIIFEP